MAAKAQRVGRRKPRVREPYDRVLIVTEGEKTEPLYFRELVSTYRINTANVEVTPSTSGSDEQPLRQLHLDAPEARRHVSQGDAGNFWAADRPPRKGEVVRQASADRRGRNG